MKMIPREWLIVVRAGSQTNVKVNWSLGDPLKPPVEVEIIWKVNTDSEDSGVTENDTHG